MCSLISFDILTGRSVTDNFRSNCSYLYRIWKREIGRASLVSSLNIQIRWQMVQLQRRWRRFIALSATFEAVNERNDPEILGGYSNKGVLWTPTDDLMILTVSSCPLNDLSPHDFWKWWKIPDSRENIPNTTRNLKFPQLFWACNYIYKGAFKVRKNQFSKNFHRNQIFKVVWFSSFERHLHWGRFVGIYTLRMAWPAIVCRSFTFGFA